MCTRVRTSWSVSCAALLSCSPALSGRNQRGACLQQGTKWVTAVVVSSLWAPQSASNYYCGDITPMKSASVLRTQPRSYPHTASSQHTKDKRCEYGKYGGRNHREMAYIQCGGPRATQQRIEPVDSRGGRAHAHTHKHRSAYQRAAPKPAPKTAHTTEGSAVSKWSPMKHKCTLLVLDTPDKSTEMLSVIIILK